MENDLPDDDKTVLGGSPVGPETEPDVDRFFGRLEQYLEGLSARYDVRPLGLSDVEAVA